MGFFIDMINVGYGDSFLLTLDGAENITHHVLIDGGNVGSGEKILDHFRSCGINHINIIFATHLDNDHIGGLKEIVESGFSIGVFVINTPGNLSNWLGLKDVYQSYGMKATSKKQLLESVQMASDLHDLLIVRGITIDTALRGEYWDFGAIKLRVLNPTKEMLDLAWADNVLETSKFEIILESIGPASQAPSTTASNNSGIVIELEYQVQPYGLFTSDVGAPILKEITEGKNYKFLKVPHHGSKTGLDKDLVKQFAGATAYIPVGQNSHGHPATEVLDLLRDVSAKTYCTERTKYCRRDCNHSGFGTLCHRKDKDSRPGWSTVDPSKCKNNQ